MRSMFGMLVAVAAVGCDSPETAGQRFDKVVYRVREAERSCSIERERASVSLTANDRIETRLSIHLGCPGTKLSKCLTTYKAQHKLSDYDFPLRPSIGGCGGME